jgi:7-cyano-7-deazaguanine reductase
MAKVEKPETCLRGFTVAELETKYGIKCFADRCRAMQPDCTCGYKKEKTVETGKKVEWVQGDPLPISGRNENELSGVSLLGNQNTKYKYDYDPSVLETFINKHQDHDYFVRFVCPEFTSLCPKTGQPDFATIYIQYIPNVKMVESKSLKLYLFSFRNHGDFHEDCMNIICNDLGKLMQPRYLEVYGIFSPRGGIAIHPFAQFVSSGYEELAAARALDMMRDKTEWRGR